MERSNAAVTPRRKRVLVGESPSTVAISAIAPGSDGFLERGDAALRPQRRRVLVGASPSTAAPNLLAPSITPVQAHEGDSAVTWRREDVRNLAIILAGWLLLVILLPPKGEYPIIDDSLHVESVRSMLDTGTFIRPTWMQANLSGLTVWGSAWSKLFGFSFSTLTASTLALALFGLYAFYGIARIVKVSAAGALFGTALLAFNPIFLHLSYSFMTDVPFVSLILIACFCYLQGMRVARYGAIWMGVGSLVALWGFYVRQFAIIVPVAFLLYLLLEGVLARKWRWWQMVGIIVPTLIGLLLWYLSERDIPPNMGALNHAGWTSRIIFQEPWLRVFLLRSLVLLPIVALSAWAAIKIRFRRWWLIPLTAAAVLWGMYNLALPGENWLLGMDQPPFTFRLGDIAIPFPQQTFTFGVIGNIIRTDGIDFFQYRQMSIFSPEVWRGLWVLGIILGVVLLAAMADALLGWIRKLVRREWRPALSPIIACYMVGAGVFVATAAFTAVIFDRYMVGFLPFVILFVVRGAAKWKRAAWAYSISTLVVIAVFSYLLQADFVDHDNARWKAGHWLRNHVKPAIVGGGWDWNTWVNGGDFTYDRIITDYAVSGMRTERTFPYFSRLGGFTTRYVLTQVTRATPRLPILPEDKTSP
ncbi:MAG TPA: glycosyltransferase family 39 protein [Chloroflexia bacterium]|nr:glycosyltransferase family 39 protein [Chloroflexia bacterium]